MVPCKDCLLIPICRNKYFVELNLDCSMMYNFLYHKANGVAERRPSFMLRVLNLNKLMNPYRWEMRENNTYLYYRTANEKGAFMIDRNMSYYVNDATANHPWSFHNTIDIIKKKDNHEDSV